MPNFCKPTILEQCRLFVSAMLLMDIITILTIFTYSHYNGQVNSYRTFSLKNFLVFKKEENKSWVNFFEVLEI